MDWAPNGAFFSGAADAILALAGALQDSVRCRKWAFGPFFVLVVIAIRG